MRPEPKKKIATNQPQAGLNQAFANLNVSGLPAGESPSAPPAKEEPAGIWKLGRVVLRKETAHRGGKTVIVVHEFATHLPVSQRLDASHSTSLLQHPGVPGVSVPAH